jgi:hypothetical protein
MDQDIVESTTSIYYKFITKFIFNLESLRIYTENVVPVVNKTLNKRKFITIKKIEEILAMLNFALKNEEKVREHKKQIESAKISLLEKYGIELQEDAIHGRGKKGMQTLEELTEYRKHENQINILYEGSFINLVVFFEIMIGSLIKNRLIKYPNSNEDIEKRTLKLEEIRKLGSIENARLYLIEEEVDSILRKGYSDWIKYIRDTNNIKLEFLKEIDKETAEIFQRRNLIVHNEGIVNNIYMKSVHSSLTEDVKLDEYLIVDEEYLNKSILLIEHVGIMLCLEIWSSMEKQSQERVNFVIDSAYRYMKKGQWDIAKAMYLSNDKEKHTSSEDKTICKMNYWVCMKQTNAFEKIKDEIYTADYSDKSIKYQLGLAALKDDKEMFYKLLPIAIQKSEVSYQDLIEWPILIPFRDDKEFIDVVVNMKRETVKLIKEVKSASQEIASASISQNDDLSN